MQPSLRKPGTDSVRFSGQAEPEAPPSGKWLNAGRRLVQGLTIGLASALSLKSLLWGAAMGALFGGIVSLIPGGLFFTPVMIPMAMAAWAGFKFLVGFAAGVSIHPDVLQKVADRNRDSFGDLEKIRKDLMEIMQGEKKK